MNNLSSYCGLVHAKIRASDKDLPVHDDNGETLIRKVEILCGIWLTSPSGMDLSNEKSPL